jgi:hypothetical protein
MLGISQTLLMCLFGAVARLPAHRLASHLLGRVGRAQGIEAGRSAGSSPSEAGHPPGHSSCSPKFARCFCPARTTPKVT